MCSYADTHVVLTKKLAEALRPLRGFSPFVKVAIKLNVRVCQGPHFRLIKRIAQQWRALRVLPVAQLLQALF